ncbi:alpha/beta hydrolase [Vibrio sp. M60_M31a]
MGLEGDPVSPHSDNQLVALFSQYGQAKKISAKSISKGYGAIPRFGHKVVGR